MASSPTLGETVPLSLFKSLLEVCAQVMCEKLKHKKSTTGDIKRLVGQLQNCAPTENVVTKKDIKDLIQKLSMSIKDGVMASVQEAEKALSAKCPKLGRVHSDVPPRINQSASLHRYISKLNPTSALETPPKPSQEQQINRAVQDKIDKEVKAVINKYESTIQSIREQYQTVINKLVAMNDEKAEMLAQYQERLRLVTNNNNTTNTLTQMTNSVENITCNKRASEKQCLAEISNITQLLE